MAREVDIDYAISETLKKHPDFAPYLSNIIYKNIYSGTNPVNFTSHVRESINTAEQVDFLSYILNEAITIYVAAKELIDENDSKEEEQNLSKHFPMFNQIQKAVDILKDKNNNVIFYYLCNRIELFELIEAVTLTIFKRQWYSNNVNKEIRTNFHNHLKRLSETNPETKTLRRMLNKETNVFKGIKNLEINYEAINRCQREIMLGNQVRNAHNDYALGDMFASQDVGKKRRNQEDSVLILEHEENPKFKILAVADGMGGHEKGEVASNFVLARISKWFNTISPEFYEYPEQLQVLFNKELLIISKELYHYFGSSRDSLVGGTTFTGAIVTKDKTIISSVGDSRAYIQKGNEVNLVTQDESYVWSQLIKEKKKDGTEITNKDIDRLRTEKHNNIITRCIGDKSLEFIQSYLINNKDYDELLLFSDGITDILSHDDIQFICSTTPPEKVAEVFVEYALSHGVTERLRGVNSEVELVSPGKDNASSAVYIRRRK